MGRSQYDDRSWRSILYVLRITISKLIERQNRSWKKGRELILNFLTYLLLWELRTKNARKINEKLKWPNRWVVHDHRKITKSTYPCSHLSGIVVVLYGTPDCRLSRQAQIGSLLSQLVLLLLELIYIDEYLCWFKLNIPRSERYMQCDFHYVLT